MDLTSDQRQAIDTLLQAGIQGDDAISLQAVKLRAGNMSPSKIAKKLGCATSVVNEAIDRFEHRGLLGLIQDVPGSVVVAVLQAAGLGAAVEGYAEEETVEKKELPPRRMGIDEKWSASPLSGTGACTPEGMMLLLAAAAAGKTVGSGKRPRSGAKSEGPSDETVEKWLIANGCTKERAAEWVKRLREYRQGVAAIGPPTPEYWASQRQSNES